jgi:hypothetical protein
MIKFSIIFVLIAVSSYLFAEKKEVAITVYNNNQALVKEIREMVLQQGTAEIKFQDVAASIDPTSVHFKSLTAPNAVTILEQNYEYDLVSSDKILEKYIDQEIKVFTEKEGPFIGTLLSSSGGNIILKLKEGNLKIIQSSAIVNIDFPQLPQGLITRPTLVWLIDNSEKKPQQTEVSYLTGNISWHAEYVAVSKNDDSELELNSWVSIENNSGTDYEKATLKLIAGDVHLAEEPRPLFRMKDSGMMAMESAAPQFEEKSFFEYHLYKLTRKATIKNNQIKQISLFPTAQTKVSKIYLYNGAQFGQDVRTILEFKNSQTTGLGIPLPKGKVRVYKEDEADKTLEFIGEDFIDHTPKDEQVKIFLGNAFDIKGERIQKTVKQINDHSREEIYEIKVRNHKQAAVKVTVVEKFWGDWKIKQQTHQFQKKDASTVEFVVDVATDGETIIEYTVLLKW